MKTLVLTLALVVGSPVLALAAPKCDSYSYCVGSETRLWESVYASAYVFFTGTRSYDDNTAAGLAEAAADRALKTWKQRHAH